MSIRRHAFKVVAGMTILWSFGASSTPGLGDASAIFVAQESPKSAFPFRLAVAGKGRALVVAHYMPFFPLSYDGLPPGEDYYAVQFLRASGESGKHARQGGFLRDRPLAAPNRTGARWLEANLAVEIARASRIGIDGFGVNLLSLTDDTYVLPARRLLDAAAASGTGFRIFPEPDMGVIGATTPVQLADALMPFARHPAALRLDNALLVMPIAADIYPAQYWRELEQEMRTRGYPITLMPCYYDPAHIGELRDVSWGVTFWGTRGATAGDNARMVVGWAEAAGYSRWMIPVSPQDARPKDLRAFEARNSESYRNQWDNAIGLGARMVHIVTWNDYSETSHISPSMATRFAFYDLTAYYVAWLKRGRAPAISRDTFYFFQRNQIFRADELLEDARWTRAGDTPWSNDVEVVALLTAPAELVLRSGSNVTRKIVAAGLQTIRVTATSGVPTLTVRRGGRDVASVAGRIPIMTQPQKHDPTYGGTSSTRP